MNRPDTYTKCTKHIQNILENSSFGSKPPLPLQFLLGNMSYWACSEASKCCICMAQSRAQHTLRGNNVSRNSAWWLSTLPEQGTKKAREQTQEEWVLIFLFARILAEGAIALSVVLSGGVLIASWKLFQFPSSLIVKVILAIKSLEGGFEPKRNFNYISGILHYVSGMFSGLEKQFAMIKVSEITQT